MLAQEKQSLVVRVSYEVTVRRMNCLPDPPEPVVECYSDSQNAAVEKDVGDEVMKVLTKATDRAAMQKEKAQKKENLDGTHGDKAFGAPIQKTDERKQRKKSGNEDSSSFGSGVGQIPQQITPPPDTSTFAIPSGV
ncbi:unnamed protein product, partial [Gongylonema pulchrum]|uniref:RED_N domain-containing protein n=1 Tax=Gongylonema pulchrum TaxID=637853 RepID=A0A183DCL8_9BILA